MTVFRGYMKIMQRNLIYLFLYTGIFLGILLAIQKGTSQQEETQYQASALTIAVIDADHSALSNGIIQTLSREHTVRTDVTDKRELAESMYYEQLDYVVQIPADAERVLYEEGGALSISKNPGDYSGMYADLELNTFLQTVGGYRAAGLDMDTAVERALRIMELSPEVTILETGKKQNGSQGYFNFFRYLPYVFLYTLCYIVPMVLRSFQERDMERRMNVSGVSHLRRGLLEILALVLLSGMLWMLAEACGFVFFGRQALADSHLGLYLVNSVCLLLTVGSIAYLLGNLLKNTQAINGAANTVALGMSFLCGVFVDMSLLSPGILAVARFLPVYWYETANQTLYEYGALTAGQQQAVLLSFGIQLAFALAVFSVTLVIRRLRLRQE